MVVPSISGKLSQSLCGPLKISLRSSCRSRPAGWEPLLQSKELQQEGLCHPTGAESGPMATVTGKYSVVSTGAGRNGGRIRGGSGPGREGGMRLPYPNLFCRTESPTWGLHQWFYWHHPSSPIEKARALNGVRGQMFNSSAGHGLGNSAPLHQHWIWLSCEAVRMSGFLKST